jgi:hypothetical protein
MAMVQCDDPPGISNKVTFLTSGLKDYTRSASRSVVWAFGLFSPAPNGSGMLHKILKGFYNLKGFLLPDHADMSRKFDYP